MVKVYNRLEQKTYFLLYIDRCMLKFLLARNQFIFRRSASSHMFKIEQCTLTFYYRWSLKLIVMWELDWFIFFYGGLPEKRDSVFSFFWWEGGCNLLKTYGMAVNSMIIWYQNYIRKKQLPLSRMTFYW